MKKISYNDFEILHDFPSGRISQTGRRYVKLISMARKEILIITPYFLPSGYVRKALRKAASKGIIVKIILPRVSDVKFLDFFRSRYIRKLSKENIKFYYYPRILHSKLLVIDDKFFLMGSSNLDYRSFMYQFELNLVGKDPILIKDFIKYFNKNLKESEGFDGKGMGGAIWHRVLERISHPFRRYL